MAVALAVTQQAPGVFVGFSMNVMVISFAVGVKLHPCVTHLEVVALRIVPVPLFSVT